MKERILQLARGEVNIEVADVVCFPASISETVSPEYSQKLDIYLQSKNGVPIKSFVYSTDHRVVLSDNQAVGTKCSVHYEVMCVGMKAGSVIEGAFQFVAQGQEFEIPYRFVVEEKLEDDTLPGQMDTLEEFAAFAGAEPANAFKLFRSGNFLRMPFMQEERMIALYEQFALRGAGGAQGMEAFLDYLNVKVPSASESDEAAGKADGGEDAAGTDEDDFEVSAIAEEGVSAGTEVSGAAEAEKTGDLFEEDAFEDMGEVAEAARREAFRKYIENKKRWQECVYCMTQLVLNPNDAFIRENLLTLVCELRDEQLEGLSSIDSLRIQIFHAYTYFLNEKMQEFRLIMDATYEQVAQCRRTDVELYCFYLYLRYLMKPGSEQKATVSRLLKKYYVEQKASLVILLMLLNVDEQLQENEVLAYEMLKEQYTLGNRSPLLYASACNVLNHNPEKLKKLEGFELQVLVFGAKNHCLSDNIREQAAHLSLYEKEFRPCVFRMLERLYAVRQDKSVLTGLLCTLISGQQTSPRYFTWYQLGIQEDVRLTGLYENYLDAMPADFAEPMPVELLLFLADRDDLGTVRKERLYHNVITYFEPGSKIYREYQEQMQAFAIEQLLQGRYNRTLTELYQIFLFEEMIDERMVQVLPAILHVTEISCESEDMEWVVIRYPQIVSEYRGRMKNGSACIPVYDKDAIILFEDKQGVRYGSIPYEMKQLMYRESFLNVCRKLGTKDMILSILDTKPLLVQELKRPEDVYRLLVLLDMAEVHGSYKKQIVSKLLHYCAGTDGLDAMDSFLLQTDVRELSGEDRILLVELLSKRGFIKEAYQILMLYGYLGVHVDVLSSVARYVVLQVSYAYDPFLLNICLELYRQNQYNGVILSYLLKYFNGITEEMLELLGVSRNEEGMQVLMSDFPERLLSQMMFTGHMERITEVFHMYLDEQDKHQLYLPLVQAYFVIQCHEYFINKVEIDEEVFQYLEQKLMEDFSYEAADLCKIALLHTYSKRGLLEKNRVTLAKTLLASLYEKGYLFAFYYDLTKHISLPETLNGKVIIEYRSGTAQQARMEWRILSKEQAETEDKLAAMMAERKQDSDSSEASGTAQSPVQQIFKKQVLMNQVLPGVYAEAVTLFDGEVLEYRVTELVEHKAVSQSEILRKDTAKRYRIKNSRFARINAAAGNKEIDVELEALLKEILLADAMADKLFPLQ